MDLGTNKVYAKYNLIKIIENVRIIAVDYSFKCYV